MKSCPINKMLCHPFLTDELDFLQYLHFLLFPHLKIKLILNSISNLLENSFVIFGVFWKRDEETLLHQKVCVGPQVHGFTLWTCSCTFQLVWCSNDCLHDGACGNILLELT